jgi:vancomycin resistance protein YoaR
MNKKRKKSSRGGSAFGGKAVKRAKSLQRERFARIFSHWAFIGILCSILVVLITLGTGWAYAKTYESRIYPGVSIGSVEVGGMTTEEARAALTKITNEFLTKGFLIRYEGRNFELKTGSINQDSHGLNRELIIFDFDEMLDQALSVGRNKSMLANIRDVTQAKTLGLTLPTEFSIDEKSILAIMQQYYQEYDSPARDARIIFDFADNSDVPHFQYEEERSGETLNYDTVLAEIERQTLFLASSDIELIMTHEEPKITLEEARSMTDEMEAVFNLAPIILTYSADFENWSWNISKQDFSTWLTLAKDDDKNVYITFLEEAVKTSLENITNTLEVEPRDAKFKMENDRVIEFLGHRDGIRVDWEATLAEFEKKIIKNNENTAEVGVLIAEPDVKIGDLNDLGIEELIGVGRSDFSGSPTNRRHNIRIGADALNGLLIAPDEEFTTIGHLTPVTAANGYLPELVIKENKTIPEYGGGLCQIGTTMFRVAISAGLPITERSPHSYRVVYYEPAGKDAAVYEMHPDVRFINDTGNYIMIQTHIQGDNLIFEFWGTDDGREVYQSDSRIYNITSPPELKEVETLDLEPGERKCTEGAHPGADAEFDYKVTYPDGRVEEETFFSHYRAWGAVCLIGVEELSESPEGEESEGGEEGTEEPASETTE